MASTPEAERRQAASPSHPPPDPDRAEHLLVLRGPLRGARFPVEPGASLRLGRDESCEIWINDGWVSRQHASIRCDAAGTVWVEDLGSSNGTRVGGDEIASGDERRLSVGDVVQVGETELQLVDHLDQERAATPESLSASSGLIRQLTAFQVQVAHVVAWEDAATLLCSTAQRLLPGEPVVCLLERREEAAGFVPWMPPSGQTLPPLPDEEAIQAALRLGEPRVVNRNEVVVPFPPAVTAPCCALYVLGGKAGEQDDLLRFLVEAASSSPAMAGEEREGPPLPRDVGMIGESEPIRRVVAEVARAARSTTPVLVLGETGSGKELVARAVHQLSGRAEEPFVPVNAAAISPELIESELFGHEKGAFTGADRRRKGFFEQAGRGTLFLDEVGELPAAAQAKLLRVLDYDEVRRVGGEAVVRSHARIVCATNRDLQAEVGAGGFRIDLYYRIAGQVIAIPPLRQRREDIPLLFKHFMARFAREQDRRPPSASEEAMARLLAHPWPGNVRELQMLARRLAASVEGDVIHPEALGLSEAEEAEPPQEETSGRTQSTERLVPLKELERQHIISVYEACGGNQSRAAEALGITRRTLYNKLKQYGRL